MKLPSERDLHWRGEASEICRVVTLLSPMWRTRPFCWSSAKAESGASMEPSAGFIGLIMILKIHDLKHVEAKVGEVVMNGLR